jgi:hypothetical protein
LGVALRAGELRSPVLRARYAALRVPDAK